VRAGAGPIRAHTLMGQLETVELHIQIPAGPYACIAFPTVSVHRFPALRKVLLWEKRARIVTAFSAVSGADSLGNHRPRSPTRRRFSAGALLSGPARGGETPLAFSTVNLLSTAFLHGRAGRFSSTFRRFPARADRAMVPPLGKAELKSVRDKLRPLLVPLFGSSPIVVAERQVPNSRATMLVNPVWGGRAVVQVQGDNAIEP
jgi:hypothetical protein